MKNEEPNELITPSEAGKRICDGIRQATYDVVAGYFVSPSGERLSEDECDKVAGIAEDLLSGMVIYPCGGTQDEWEKYQ